jgi:hypothetical protein
VTALQRDDQTFGEWQHKMRMPDDVLAEFHAWARREIEAYAGRPIAWSANGIKNRPYEESFDYFISEIDLTRSAAHYLQQAREIKARGKFLVLTGQKDLEIRQFRLAIALAYATGNGIVLPWDQFNADVIRNPAAERTFVDPHHLADLTGFVRACAGLLDGHEDAAVAGYSLEETRYGERIPMAVEGGSGRLSALARAQPGKPDSPVVIHLVEAGDPQPAFIKLRVDSFFPNAKLNLKLLTPAAFDQAAHDKAEESGDYSGLVSESSVGTKLEGGRVVAELPGLNPWAILLVSPD